MQKLSMKTKPGCSSTRLAEYRMTLLDLCNRLAGGNVGSRFFPQKKTAKVLFGGPIDASAIFERPGAAPRINLRRFDTELKGMFGNLAGQLEERYG